MITIYHSPLTRSCRIVWLAEELGLQYNLHSMELFSTEMESPEYATKHPLGKVPAIDDDGFVLWETLAIMEYLVAKYSDGALIPSRATQQGAKVVQWMEFAENQLTVLASEIVVHDGILPEARTIPQLIERGRNELPKLLAIVENALADQDYIAGDTFTAADIMLGFALPIAGHVGMLTESTPRINAYLQRLTARPGYAVGMG